MCGGRFGVTIIPQITVPLHSAVSCAALPALSSDDLLRAIDETALGKGWENRSGNGTSERGGKREGK